MDTKVQQKQSNNHAAKASFIPPTKRAILLSSVLHEPFASLYPLLPFILLKDLGATPFEIVVLIMLKPVVAIFSFYWSSQVKKRRDLLRMNLFGAGLLARVPLLVGIYFENVWLLIIASALYMLFSRASIPAWMEMLKLNLPAKIREKLFSVGSAIGYAEGVILAVGIGVLLDYNIVFWKWLYSGSIIVGIIGVVVQCWIPIRGEHQQPEECMEKTEGFRANFVKPWKDSMHLMRTRPDFARFQMGFMACGFGLMLIQPVIPIFFDQVLHLSYKNLMIAYSICKGLGFVFTSRLWSRALARISVSCFTSFVLFGFASFPLLIFLSSVSHAWLYLAYVVYGVSQAGSHLIWHLSGPMFADHEDSSTYSGVNIVMVGLRGLVAPPLGGLICGLSGPYAPLALCMMLSLLGIGFMTVRAPKRLIAIPKHASHE